MDDAEETEPAFGLRVAVQEEGEFVDFLNPRFDEKGAFGKFSEAVFCKAMKSTAGGAIEFFCDPVFVGVLRDEVGDVSIAELRGERGEFGRESFSELKGGAF